MLFMPIRIRQHDGQVTTVDLAGATYPNVALAFGAHFDPGMTTDEADDRLLAAKNQTAREIVATLQTLHSTEGGQLPLTFRGIPCLGETGVVDNFETSVVGFEETCHDCPFREKDSCEVLDNLETNHHSRAIGKIADTGVFGEKIPQLIMANPKKWHDGLNYVQQRRIENSCPIAIINSQADRAGGKLPVRTSSLCKLAALATLAASAANEKIYL